MKKTRFFLMALLLVTVLVFTSCGSKDENTDAIPDDQQNTVEQDIEDGAEDIKDDAQDVGDDIKDGVEDAADDVKDAVDGDENGTVGNGNTAGNAADDADQKDIQ